MVVTSGDVLGTGNADSLLLSILLLLWGFWGAEGEVLQHPEVICWLGFPACLWDSVTTNTGSVCLGRAMLCAMGAFLKGQQGRFGVCGLGKQEWELLHQ